MTKNHILERIDENIIKVWNSQSDQPLSDKELVQCDLKEISEQIKKENESLLNEFISNVNKKSIDFDSFIGRENILYVKKYLGESLYKEYFDNIATFYNSIRNIEPQFDLSQLWQVTSNYLVYAIILAMLGEKQQCNDSIKAFCLLYPYTDNYIDSKDISLDDKAKFNDMIYASLNDLPVILNDNLSKKIYSCLKDCQNHLDGTRKDIVTAALLLMLDSQRNSSSLDGMTSEKYDDNYIDLVGMLAYKGGMTIVNDYIFAVTKEKSRDLNFFLQLGMVLQLADDLLDTDDDVVSNSPTLFSLVPDIETRENNINRLMRYTINVFSEYVPYNEQVHAFMLRTIMIMFGFAVLRNKKYYSDKFVDNICRFMPFTKEYLVDINLKLSDATDCEKCNLQKIKNEIDSIISLLRKEMK